MMSLFVIGQIHASKSKLPFNFTWPMKKASEVEGDLILGGLMMIHEREDDITCGPVMPQGGIQVIILFVSLLKYHKKCLNQLKFEKIFYNEK